MPLRARLESHPETIQDFELAAEEKYWEGADLLASGHHGAGIYLLGYTAEMLLKLSCFRLDKIRPSDPIYPFFGPAKTWMKSRLPDIPFESYHSLFFWMNLLRDKRRFLGRPLPTLLDAVLVQRMRRLYQIWWIEMRYRPEQTYPREPHIVYDDVSWIRHNYKSLWR